MSETIQYNQTVYIEDTDAYQILYNTNYLKYIERAYFQHTHQPSIHLVGIHMVRYRDSALLGDELTILITPGKDPSYYDGKVMRGSDTLVFFKGIEFGTSSDATLPCPKLSEYRVKPQRIFQDDFSTYGLRLDRVLSLFEQRRSDELGGPSVLQRLKEKYLLVVGKVSNLRLITGVETLIPGMRVQNIVRMKQTSESIFDFDQLLCYDGKVLASGTITVVCCDVNTRKMCAYPDSLLDS